MSHFLVSSHMCSTYCLFNHSRFLMDTPQVLFNSCVFCSFQQDPVCQEDWKSTVCLGRSLGQHLRCLYQKHPVSSLGGHVAFLQFTSAFVSCFSLISYHSPFFSFLFSFSLHLLLSLLLLEFPGFFSFILHLLLFTFSSSFILLEAY